MKYEGNLPLFVKFDFHLRASSMISDNDEWYHIKRQRVVLRSGVMKKSATIYSEKLFEKKNFVKKY